jgi:hypothetical protein
VRRVVPSQLTILPLLCVVVLLAVPAVAQEQTGTLHFLGSRRGAPDSTVGLEFALIRP